MAMKVAGFLLLVAGWAIVLSALALLSENQVTARTGFVVAGLCVEGLGLVLAVRSHILRRGYRS